MQTLTFIPDHIIDDIEMLSWLEEQMATVTYEAQLAYSDICHDEEDLEWACL